MIFKELLLVWGDLDNWGFGGDVSAFTTFLVFKIVIGSNIFRISDFVRIEIQSIQAKYQKIVFGI